MATESDFGRMSRVDEEDARGFMAEGCLWSLDIGEPSGVEPLRVRVFFIKMGLGAFMDFFSWISASCPES